MKLSTLLTVIPQLSAGHYPDITIQDLCLDSRNIKNGDAFFACVGTERIGHQFIDEAIEKGASVVFAEKEDGEVIIRNNIPIISVPNLSAKLGSIADYFYDSPSKKLQIIGVTGTSGKTSCAYFIASAFNQLGITCGMIGTLGNGLFGEIQSSSLTTPDAISLHKLLSQMVKQGASIVVMEVSSHALQQGRVNEIEFTIGIFTNLSHDHLDYHVTLAAYGAAEKQLFNQTKMAVINIDDAFGKEIFNEICHKQPVIAYTTNTKNLSQNLVLAKEVSFCMDGLHAEITTPWGEGTLQAKLIGQFNISNLLAVISALCSSGISLPTALQCVFTFQAVPGRMQMLKYPGKPLVVVDYAHKPDALKKVLTALRAHCEGKLYCIFGCGGNRDRTKRAIMAKIAETLADKVIVTDDNPRYENPQQILDDIIRGFSTKANVIVEHNRSKAIRNTIYDAIENDCILIAGKGSETYQQIGDTKFPFSDVEKAIFCLSGEDVNAGLVK